MAALGASWRGLPRLTSGRLYIYGLAQTVTVAKLKNAFTPYGNVVDAYIHVDKETGKQQAHGYVTYNSIEEAERARQAMNNKFLHNWIISVKQRT